MSEYNGETVMALGKAAKRLGIDRNTLMGLIVAKNLNGYKVVGQTGKTLWLIPERVVRELEAKMKSTLRK